jgi:hypothetical protein
MSIRNAGVGIKEEEEDAASLHDQERPTEGTTTGRSNWPQPPELPTP